MYQTLFFVILLVYLTYKWSKSKYEYWKKRGVKYLEPSPFFGNYYKVLSRQLRMGDLWKNVYKNNKDETFIGLYEGVNPVLLLINPEIIKHVLVKDFSYFIDRVRPCRRTYIDDNIFFIGSDRWRSLRTKLSTMFTSSKVKNMVPIMDHYVVDRLIRHVDNKISTHRDQDLKSLVHKYSLEVLCSCAFGIETDALNGKAEIFEEIKRIIFRPPISIQLWTSIDLVMPEFVDLINKLNYHPQVDKKVLSFFKNLTDNLLTEREGKATTSKHLIDLIMMMMIEVKDQDNVRLEMDRAMLATQAFGLFGGGIDTTATTISFLLYELALNEKYQERAYQEIVTVVNKYNGRIDYDSIKDLQYLSMCFDETLRKYPATKIQRICTKNYNVPGTNLTIEKGVKVAASTFGMHMDDKYFPNPNKFDPERFSPENKKMPACVYLPFGDGPKYCIGVRFAKISTLLMVSNFLKNFKFTPSEGISSKKVKFSNKNLTLAPEGGLMVNITKR